MGFLKKKRTDERVLRIAVDKLIPNESQPRTVFEDGALSALALSIRRYGVLQPVSVRAKGDGYEIIAGERRVRAAKMAGLATVPCIVYAVEGESSALLSVMENLLREDLNMFETAVALERLSREYGLTQEEIAERLSVSQSYVANKLRLLRFDEGMREKILSSHLTERHARALLRLPPEERAAMADRIIEKNANVETAERMIEAALSEGEKRKKTKRPHVKGAIRDIRLFYNSIDRAVEMVRRCGVKVDARREEAEEGTVLIISIPKSV